MTKRMALDVDQMTPFARMVYDYLLSFRPNKIVAELSEETGISNQTIWDWLRKGTIPRRSTIVQLAERSDLPLDELLLAAGLPTTEQVRRERLAQLDMLRGSIDDAMALVNADPTYSDADRAVIRRFLERRPDEFIQAADTWREYHHASPTAFAAEQSQERATVFEPEPISTSEEAHGQPRAKQRGQQSRHTTGA